LQFHVGCCGFSISRKRYYGLFDVVELQETFYDPPNMDRLKALRSEAPSNFTFTLKCWQAVTHPLSSQTWRRAKHVPDKALSDRYGFLKPTREVFEAWNMVLEGAKVLDAKVIVIQTPPSFNCTDENYNNAIQFFSAASSSNIILGWEPRGDWLEKPERILDVVGRFRNVIHIVDPFRAKPALVRDKMYFRLHGIGGGEVNYRYKYTDEDLSRLKSMIMGYKAEGASEFYVMFNNVYMAEDASRFKQLIAPLR
jgi:uncharacterized protein YecE (DUF72 family)